MPSNGRGKVLPNKRLKLTAPGLGKNCVCAPAVLVVGSIDAPPTQVGAAA
jgi:hypothetical protein